MIRSDYLKIKDYIPKLSGIYTFRDKRRRPLYIGKAKNLSSRIKSYFSGQSLPMTKKMVASANSITWQETLSDIEALILESVSIKKYRPPFNTLLRDDKQYFYVGFNKEIFPRLIVAHQTKKSRINYIGPFTDGGALRLTLRTLRKIFPYCTCKQKHRNYCLNYHIGNCLGYCCLKNITSTEDQKKNYKKNIRSIKTILTGKKTQVLDDLIDQLLKKEKVDDSKGLAELNRQISKLQRFFLNAQVIKRIGKSNRQLLYLAKYLILKYKPVRIEGYDISNISGLFATGAMVVFTNGLEDKNEYRKFKIKTISGTNDTAMLKEVLSRRLKHDEWPLPQLIVIDGGKGQLNAVKAVLQEYGQDIPVVGLIKNEKHTGERVLLDSGSIISLSSLPADVRNLLLSVDAEAHRFAIQYYRKRHSFKK